MAHMNQQKKQIILQRLKDSIPYGWKYSLGVRNGSTIACVIQAAPVELVKEFNRVKNINLESPRNIETHCSANPFYPEREFDESLLVIKLFLEALNIGNHNKSNSMEDSHNIGHFVDLEIGSHKKPFEFRKMASLKNLPEAIEYKVKELIP